MAEQNSHLFVFSGKNKAGMEEVDAKQQNQVIYEMSKKSAYYDHAKKLDTKSEERIHRMKISIDTLSAEMIYRLKEQVDGDLQTAEQNRSLDRICCVLDMDMFYAAVEIRDRPELTDLPVAVGGLSMICTANYVARKYGVRSAMPGFIARKLCPKLIFIPPNFEKYKVASNQMLSVIRFI